MVYSVSSVGVRYLAQQSAGCTLGSKARRRTSSTTPTSVFDLPAAVMAIEYPRHTDDADDEVDSDDHVSLWSGSSDTSSEIVELDQNDFPAYFTEREGRLFHSHGNAPYPLPVDAHEQHVRSQPAYTMFGSLTPLRRTAYHRAACSAVPAARQTLCGACEACPQEERGRTHDGARFGLVHGNWPVVSRSFGCTDNRS